MTQYTNQSQPTQSRNRMWRMLSYLDVYAAIDAQSSHKQTNRNRERVIFRCTSARLRNIPGCVALTAKNMHLLSMDRDN